MVSYKCETCNQEFDKKSHFENHKKRTNKCEPSEKPNKKLEKHSCIYCGREISTRIDNYKRHEKTCGPKYNNIPMNSRNNINNQDTNILTNTNNNAINSNNTTNSNNTNITNNVNLVLNVISNVIFPYTCHLGLLYMFPDEIHRIFNSTTNPYVIFFELIHCNRDRPSYHNLIYTDSETIKVYNGNNFVDKKSGKVMTYLLENQRSSMIEYLENSYQILNDEIINKIYDTIVSIQVTKDSKSKDMESIIKKINKIRSQMLSSIKNMHQSCYQPYNNYNKNKLKTNMLSKEEIRRKIELLPRKMFPPISKNMFNTINSSDSMDTKLRSKSDSSSSTISDDNSESSDDSESADHIKMKKYKRSKKKNNIIKRTKYSDSDTESDSDS